MKKLESVEEIYRELDNAIDSYTTENIDKVRFLQILDQLNDNEFGVKIDKDLVTDNRNDFNEAGFVSYEDSYDY